MYANEKLLMRSKKSNSVIVYGLIIISIFVFVPIYAICIWIRWFFEKGESSLTSLNSNKALIILATPIFLSAFTVYALYLGVLTITLTVLGQQYSIAAKNVEQCMQMIAEMKYRNMQFYHNSYYPP